MNISIVVCTKNRAEKLTKSLNEINRLDNTGLNVQLVIVDNNSSDNTQEIIKDFLKISKFNTTSIIEEKKGVSAARNKGIKHSTGKIIVIVDDDCYLEKNYLLVLSSQFRNNKIGFVAGRILLYDKNDSRTSTIYNKNNKLFREYEFIQPGSVMGANIAFRKNVLKTVNYFDPLLGAGTKFAAEDIDCAYRILAKGWEGIYRSDLIVYHHHGRKNLSELRQLKKFYAKGEGAYLLKCFFNPLFRIWTKLSVIKCFIKRRNINKVHVIMGVFEYFYYFMIRKLKQKIFKVSSD